MSRDQAVRAAQLLGVHWTTVYRLRSRFLANPVTSSVAPRPSGPKNGSRRIPADAEEVIADVLTRWLPKHKQLANPLADIHMV